MTCYHPLIAERLSPRSVLYNPKQKVKILGSAERNSDLLRLEQSASSLVSDVFLVPCGRCVGCRIDKARDWSVRIMCETYTSSSAWFLTLTYDDLHLNNLSLSKKDFQSFIKALRHYLDYRYSNCQIRYFGCGEYGDCSGRKHLHILIWNLPELDFKPRSASRGHIYYESSILNDLWSKGFVVCAQVVPEVANYVARYTLKKAGLKDYKDLSVEPPFILMSSRPGIGYNYFKLHESEIIRDRFIFIGHSKASIPRYFKNLLPDDIKSSIVDEIKERAFDKSFMKEVINDRYLSDLLISEEENVKSNIQERSLI